MIFVRIFAKFSRKFIFVPTLLLSEAYHARVDRQKDKMLSTKELDKIIMKTNLIQVHTMLSSYEMPPGIVRTSG
jgi:hypothetical protein